MTYKFHPSQIVDFETGRVNSAFQNVLINQANLIPGAASVIKFPLRFLRGHTLVDGLGHFLAETKHRPKCSKQFLLHLDVISWDENPALLRIVGEVSRSIPKPEPMS